VSELLKVPEAARRLGLSPRTIRTVGAQRGNLVHGLLFVRDMPSGWQKSPHTS